MALYATKSYDDMIILTPHAFRETLSHNCVSKEILG